MGLGSILGSIAGGLLSKGKDPFTPAQNIGSLVRGALKWGDRFNPLTLLRAGAGMGGFPGSAGLDMSGPLAELGGMFDNSAKTWANSVPKTDAMAQAIQRREIDALQNQTLTQKRVPENFGYNLHANTVPGPVTVSASPLTGAPPPNPFVVNASRRWVRDPAGNLVDMPADVADRLGVQTGGNLMAGDWTEIKGELMGETEVLAAQPEIAKHLTKRDLLGFSTEPAKTAKDAKSGGYETNGPFIQPWSWGF